MGVIQQFSILFAGGKNVFTAKEHVAGEVVLTLAEPMKLKGVELTLRGHAKTTKSGNLLEPQKDKSWIGQTNEYLNTMLQLTAASTKSLPAGQSRLPFSFLLPEGLPTSFESRHARIRYWLEAVILRPSWFKTKRRTLLQGFTVIDHVDVNQPELLAPVQASKERSIGFFCKKSFQATATLHRQGYCPGESIAINLELVNGTKKPLQSHVALLQQVGYRIKGKTFSDSQQVNAMDLGVLPKTQRQHSGTYYIQVPAIAPSINSCKIITVSYVLEFRISIPGTTEKFSFDCPFSVGTILFRQPPAITHNPQPQLDNFTLNVPAPMDWPSGGLAPFGPSMGLEPSAPNPYPSCEPPAYPGGPSPQIISMPSAPPLPEYESGSGTFTPSRTALTPLRNTPDLPEFHMEPQTVHCPAERPASDTPTGANNRRPPVARKPSSPVPSRSSPAIPNGGVALVLPKAGQAPVRLKPVRPAPASPGTRSPSAPDLPTVPPPNITPRLHVFEETSPAGDSPDVVHAYAECIFGNSDTQNGSGGGGGGGRGEQGEDSDYEDQDPETYSYVPIYAWALPTPQPSITR